MTTEPTRRVVGTEVRDSHVLLTVEHLSKKFCRSLKRSLFYGVQDIATELVGGRRKDASLRPREFWALRDVSCQLRRGEALGLVGSNGAGKSTLLRIISGLIKPDTGSATVRGKVAPLIALGAGFNPVLTGRENIYANMSILGLSTREIDYRLDTVLDFAEIESDALGAPVRTYSSGMAARLGFACAIHTDPDILLIDEVLSVGDVKFRMKCYRRLARLREAGTSCILVSHNPHAVLSICDSAIYLSKGRLLATGTADEVLRKYEEDLFGVAGESSANSLLLPVKPEGESSGLDIVSLHFKDELGEPLAMPTSGEPLTFCVACKVSKRIEDVNLTLLVREQAGEGEWVLRLSTVDDGSGWKVSPGEHEMHVEMPYCGLRPGHYVMKMNVSEGAFYLLDAVETFSFSVGGSRGVSNSSFYQQRSWKIISRDAINTL